MALSSLALGGRLRGAPTAKVILLSRTYFLRCYPLSIRISLHALLSHTLSPDASERNELGHARHPTVVSSNASPQSSHRATVTRQSAARVRVTAQLGAPGAQISDQPESRQSHRPVHIVRRRSARDHRYKDGP